MYFSELSSEQLFEIDGGCGWCTAGGILGGAGTVGGIVACFTPAAPAVIVGCVVGGILGYAMTR